MKWEKGDAYVYVHEDRLFGVCIIRRMQDITSMQCSLIGESF
jgi:hypothetical protein